MSQTATITLGSSSPPLWRKGDRITIDGVDAVVLRSSGFTVTVSYQITWWARLTYWLSSEIRFARRAISQWLYEHGIEPWQLAEYQSLDPEEWDS